jgi:hypothetical protein
LNNSLKTWAGEVTTGHGVMIVASTLLAALSGSVNWATAAPLLTAGAIGLVWPENTALQNAGETVAADVAGLVTAFENKGVPPASGTPLGSVPPA